MFCLSWLSGEEDIIFRIIPLGHMSKLSIQLNTSISNNCPASKNYYSIFENAGILTVVCENLRHPKSNIRLAARTKFLFDHTEQPIPDPCTNIVSFGCCKACCYEESNIIYSGWWKRCL